MKLLAPILILFSACSINRVDITIKYPITNKYYFEYSHIHIEDQCFEVNEFILVEQDTLYLDNFKKSRFRK